MVTFIHEAFRQLKSEGRRLQSFQVFVPVMSFLLLLLLSIQALGQSPAELALRQKAEKGDAQAQFDLCRSLNGQGQHAEASRWLLLSAQKGFPMAMFGVAQEYSSSRDYGQALKWYQRCANSQLDPHYKGVSMGWIGHSYRDGLGVSQDHSQAAIWYKRAIVELEKYQNSVPESVGRMYDYLCDLYLSSPSIRDYSQALKWYRKSADMGNMGAMYQLGIMYRDGEGVPKDLQKAGEWFYKAARKGHAKARKEMERKGIKVPQDM